MHPRSLTCAWTALLLSACASMSTPRCAPGEEPFIHDQLYFGTATPSGSVSAADWENFLSTEVTPRFPRGLSVWPAAGQWQGANGAVTRESSYVLSLLHPADQRSEEAIHAISAQYKQRFSQEAVLRVKQSVCASF